MITGCHHCGRQAERYIRDRLQRAFCSEDCQRRHHAAIAAGVR